MTEQAQIALCNLHLPCTIGQYPAGTVAPDRHLLDLVISVTTKHVLIPADDMARVFDYDPLLARVMEIARAQHYETQEYLLTRIVQACAAYRQITGLDAQLHKGPVAGGSAGVRLVLGAEALARIRTYQA